MRIVLLLCALAMPLVAAFAQRGAFGPTNGVVSEQFPTLLAAQGYAFSIWGLIFALDLVFGVWQARPRQLDDELLARIRAPAAIGFAATAAWMPIFSQRHFWLALLVIWVALACLVHCAIQLSRAEDTRAGRSAWAWLPLSLHAGWLSLAAFLNTAQVIVAYRLLPVDAMLPWSAVLFAAAACLLLVANHRMRGNAAYAAVAIWGLAAVHAKQSTAPLAGAGTAAWIAAALAVMLAGQTAWLRLRTGRARERRGRMR